MSNSEILQIVFSGLVTLSTIVYAFLTAKLVSETRKSRELQTTPVISIYLEDGEADITFQYIVFENIGYGVAKDVNFKILRDFDFYSHEYDRMDGKGIFVNGLSYFYPKQKFKYLLAHLPSIPVEKRNESLEIEVDYKDIFGKKVSSIFCIKLNEYYGTSQLTPPNSYVGRISYELQEIRRILKTKLLIKIDS
jgi:hypothetical protein